MHTHKARKRFGQNFLHDPGIINQIIRSINPVEKNHLVEIGPGQGALTADLLASGCRLNAIELDRDLIPILEGKFSHIKHFHLQQADALEFDYSSLQQRDEKLRIVGNLPYNISTPLIFHLLSYHQLISDMHFMLQLEVVNRLAASPGSKTYGRLSVMAQYYCQIDALFEVPPEAFDPRPKVQSAIIRLAPYDQRPYQADNIKTLDIILRTAFNQRRKTLRNNLKSLLTEKEIESLDIDPTARAETLSLPEFIKLSNILNTKKTT